MKNAFNNYETFEQEIVDFFENDYTYDYDADYEYEIVSVNKCNETKKGVMAKYRSNEPSPVVYFKDAFEVMQREHMSGKDIVIWIEDQLYKARQVMPDEVMNAIPDIYKLTAENVKPVVINTERNQELIKKIPHRSIADLTLVYYREFGNEAQALITNEFAEAAEMTEESLFELANDYAIHHATIQSFMDFVTGRKPVLLTDEDAETDFDAPFLILRNCDVKGDGVIASDWVLEEVKQILGCNFYILPSSIHEVLVIKDDGAFGVEQLREMVMGVNAQEVKPEDFLSDNVYYYDGENVSVL